MGLGSLEEAKERGRGEEGEDVERGGRMSKGQGGEDSSGEIQGDLERGGDQREGNRKMEGQRQRKGKTIWAGSDQQKEFWEEG